MLKSLADQGPSFKHAAKSLPSLESDLWPGLGLGTSPVRVSVPFSRLLFDEYEEASASRFCLFPAGFRIFVRGRILSHHPGGS